MFLKFSGGNSSLLDTSVDGDAAFERLLCKVNRWKGDTSRNANFEVLLTFL